MARVMLREIAHSRAGDKSDTSNLSVIPYEGKYYEYLKGVLTEQRVKDYFKSLCFGNVTRYDVDSIKSFNFVLENTLDGGNTRSLRPDGYGKSLSAYLLSMYVDIPDNLL
jgi:hypothetical protein